MVLVPFRKLVSKNDFGSEKETIINFVWKCDKIKAPSSGFSLSYFKNSRKNCFNASFEAISVRNIGQIDDSVPVLFFYNPERRTWYAFVELQEIVTDCGWTSELFILFQWNNKEQGWTHTMQNSLDTKFDTPFWFSRLEGVKPKKKVGSVVIWCQGQIFILLEEKSPKIVVIQPYQEDKQAVLDKKESLAWRKWERRENLFNMMQGKRSQTQKLLDQNQLQKADQVLVISRDNSTKREDVATIGL